MRTAKASAAYKAHLKAKKVQARNGDGSSPLAKGKLASSSHQAHNSADVNLAAARRQASRTLSGHPLSDPGEDTDSSEYDSANEDLEGDEPTSNTPDLDDTEVDGDSLDEEAILAMFRDKDPAEESLEADEAMNHIPDLDDMDDESDEQDEQDKPDLVALLKDLERQRNAATGQAKGALTKKYKLMFREARNAGLVVRSQYLKLTSNEEQSPLSATTQAKAKKSPPAKVGSSSQNKNQLSEEYVHDSDELESVQDKPVGEGKKRKRGKLGGSGKGAKSKKNRVA